MSRAYCLQVVAHQYPIPVMSHSHFLEEKKLTRYALDNPYH